MAFLLLWQVEASDTHGRRPSTKEGSSWGHSERRISLAASLSFLDSISAVNVDESDDDFFSKRDVPASNTDQFTQYLEQNMDEEKRTNIESYLKATPEDEKERFLLDYIKNMRWKDEGDDFDFVYPWGFRSIYRNGNEPGEEKTKEDLEEDIKDIDQQDRYEYLFNTRFEQDSLVTYPRYSLSFLFM